MLDPSVSDFSWRSNAIPAYLNCIVIGTKAIEGVNQSLVDVNKFQKTEMQETVKYRLLWALYSAQDTSRIGTAMAKQEE